MYICGFFYLGWIDVRKRKEISKKKKKKVCDVKKMKKRRRKKYKDEVRI